jgi:hypothetical protein
MEMDFRRTILLLIQCNNDYVIVAHIRDVITKGVTFRMKFIRAYWKLLVFGNFLCEWLV